MEEVNIRLREGGRDDGVFGELAGEIYHRGRGNVESESEGRGRGSLCNRIVGMSVHSLESKRRLLDALPIGLIL